MRCKQARILISAALDGELLSREESALSRHMASCAACAREREELIAVCRVMETWKDEEPSALLAQRFSYQLCKLQTEVASPKVRRSGWLFGTAAASLVTAALAIVLVLHSHVVPSGPGDATSTPRATTIRKEQPLVTKMPSTPVSKPTSPAPAVTTAKEETPEIAKDTSIAASAAETTPARRATYAPRSVFRASYAYRLSSRSYNLEERRARRALVEKMLKAAKDSKGDATKELVNHLDNAGSTVDESYERIRGVLCKTADTLSRKSESKANASGNTVRGDGL